MPKKVTTKVRSVIKPVILNSQSILVVRPGIPDVLIPSVPTVITREASYESLTSIGHKGPPFNEGGPFIVKRAKSLRTISTRNVRLWEGAVANSYNLYDLNTNSWTGLTVPEMGSTVTTAQIKAKYDAMSFPAEDLNVWGATGVAKYSPLNPGASAGIALVELYRDGLPSLISRTSKQLSSLITSLSRGGSGFSSRGLASAAGQDYLNLNFGWKPLLRDIRDIYNTWNDLDTMLAQIVRDNNQPVRRGGTLRKTVSVTDWADYGAARVETPNVAHEVVQASDPSYAKSKTQKRTAIYERIWFKGQFRYHIPELRISSDEWSRNAKLELLGLYPSPHLLYQLMPWSWLADWFTNFGDVISNLSKNGIADLVIDYAYVMRHYKKETQYVTTTRNLWEINYINGPPMKTVLTAPVKYFKTVYLEEQKERIASTPFGFGLQLTDLTDRQYAILIALGLSRTNFA